VGRSYKSVWSDVELLSKREDVKAEWTCKNIQILDEMWFVRGDYDARAVRSAQRVYFLGRALAM